ncbi:MAG: HlyD family efflux transporter periplasmic adaptor subunit [Phycisphaeraceae bacterium]|nr:HlyD family efflux transporter periplasmic adaptor subunit [Phycisphaeraceae bacterium]
MARLRRIILPLLVFALVVAGLVMSIRPRPAPVDLADVVSGPLQVTVNEDGRTRVKERYVVFSPLAGRLARIPYKAGEPVQAGRTLLAAIDPSDPDLLDARAVAEAEARVRAAALAVERARTQVIAANAALEFATDELRRVQSSASQAAANLREVQDAQLVVTVRTEEARAAEFARQIAVFELAQAEAALVRTRPADGGADAEAARLTILSPIDGRVLRVLRESAGFVSPGTPLVEIGDSTDLEIEVDVLSPDAVRIAPGAAVHIEDWGGTGVLRGRVRLVEPSAFTKISALGVEEQRVNVIIDFADAPASREGLGDGYRVQTRIVVADAADVMKVPTGALFRQGDKWAAFVEADGRASMRLLEIGRRNHAEAEVLSGLSVGDRVVVYPSDRVREGVMLAPRKAAE